MAALTLLLLLCATATCANAAPAGPLVWPLPRSMGPAGSSGTLDASTFLFKSVGKNSGTLTSAFERYAKLLAGEGTAAQASADTLAGLSVNVASDSLSLGIDTSEAYTLTVAFPWAPWPPTRCTELCGVWRRSRSCLLPTVRSQRRQ